MQPLVAQYRSSKDKAAPLAAFPQAVVAALIPHFLASAKSDKLLTARQRPLDLEEFI
jgi:hypothetical protein